MKASESTYPWLMRIRLPDRDDDDDEPEHGDDHHSDREYGADRVRIVPALHLHPTQHAQQREEDGEEKLGLSRDGQEVLDALLVRLVAVAKFTKVVRD